MDLREVAAWTVASLSRCDRQGLLGLQHAPILLLGDRSLAGGAVLFCGKPWSWQGPAEDMESRPVPRAGGASESRGTRLPENISGSSGGVRLLASPPGLCLARAGPLQWLPPRRAFLAHTPGFLTSSIPVSALTLTLPAGRGLPPPRPVFMGTENKGFVLTCEALGPPSR